MTCAFTTPFLGRWLDQAESRRVAEWAARIVVSYLLCPADGVDLTDPRHVRRLVRLFVLPGIRALRCAPGAAARRRSPGGAAATGRDDLCSPTHHWPPPRGKHHDGADARHGRHHRPRRHQRSRGDPLGREHRRRRRAPRRAFGLRHHLHVGLRQRGSAPSSRSSTRRPRRRSGTARPTSPGRPRSTRSSSWWPTPWPTGASVKAST